MFELEIGTRIYINGVLCEVVSSGRKSCNHCEVHTCGIKYDGVVCGTIKCGNVSRFNCDKGDRKDGISVMFQPVK